MIDKLCTWLPHLQHSVSTLYGCPFAVLVLFLFLNVWHNCMTFHVSQCAKNKKQMLSLTIVLSLQLLQIVCMMQCVQFSSVRLLSCVIFNFAGRMVVPNHMTFEWWSYSLAKRLSPKPFAVFRSLVRSPCTVRLFMILMFFFLNLYTYIVFYISVSASTVMHAFVITV